MNFSLPLPGDVRHPNSPLVMALEAGLFQIQPPGEHIPGNAEVCGGKD